MTHFAAVSVAFMVSSSVVLVEGNVTCYTMHELHTGTAAAAGPEKGNAGIGSVIRCSALGGKGEGGRKSGTSSKYSRKLHYNARHFR